MCIYLPPLSVDDKKHFLIFFIIFEDRTSDLYLNHYQSIIYVKHCHILIIFCCFWALSTEL